MSWRGAARAARQGQSSHVCPPERSAFSTALPRFCWCRCSEEEPSVRVDGGFWFQNLGSKYAFKENLVSDTCIEMQLLSLIPWDDPNLTFYPNVSPGCRCWHQTTAGSSSQTSHSKNSPFQCDRFNNDTLYCTNSTEAGAADKRAGQWVLLLLLI